MLTSSTRQREFPTLDEMVYLNTAAEGISPRAVISALHQYAKDKQLGMDGRGLHERQWQMARQGAARAFGLSEDEIGICSSSSEAFNLAALALQLRSGDEVVINDLDFPSGATPWLQSCCAATVRIWRSHQGALRAKDLQALLSPRTRLVTSSLVSFFNGFRLPLAETIATVRQYSPALVALDVTQALGRIELDLRDVDLIVSSTHKWLMASHGGGLVGVPKSRAEQWTAPAGGWFNRQNAFDADRFDRAPPKPGAASFCTGMPNYPAVYTIAAAFDYLDTIGVASIQAHTTPLVRACLDEIIKLPVECLTPDESDSLAGIVAFRHPQALNLYEKLHAKNIHVMQHVGRLRVAVHGYNSSEDIDRFLCALREALDEL